MKNKAITITKKLTLEQKAALLTGQDVWSTVAIADLGIPSVRMSDGPGGVRIAGVKANCFPSGCALANSFSQKTAKRLGGLIGKEFSHFGVDLMLGPAQNLKRYPLCGRNFEYYSEDACLSGEMSAAYVEGAQEYVACCVKHFAANNREFKRMSVDVQMSKRALHETYLSSFRRIVKKAKPKTLMCSYNKINGVYAGENKYVLDEVLRQKWGFDGIVVSDWGAVNDKVQSVEAGLHLEMPANPANSDVLVQAVKEGRMKEEVLNERVVEYLCTVWQMQKQKIACDLPKNLAEAAEVATECPVLLKNDGVLPLKNEGVVYVAGDGAVTPRIQGGGCAAVDVEFVYNPVEELQKALPNANVSFKRDDEIEGVAGNCDAVVYYLQIPVEDESEGYDRSIITLPKAKLDLLQRLYQQNKNVVVVLTGGSMVDTSWDHSCGALLCTYLLGGAFGRIVASVLSGKANPSGRLAESWLYRLQDASCYPFVDGTQTEYYGEDIFVGYKFYNARKMPVKYPFGYGLSYTQFAYSNVEITKDCVQFDLQNVGNVDGGEVVQVYVGKKDDAPRPEGELKAFDKIFLKAGERRHVCLVLDDFAYETYDEKTDDLAVVGGEYVVSLRKNAVEIIAQASVQLPLLHPIVYDENSQIGLLLRTETGIKVVENQLKPYLIMAIIGNFNTELEMKNGLAVGNPMFNSIMSDMPLRALYNLTAGKFTKAHLQEILKLLNEA